ncbi:MAG: hypothetical protein UR93_C0009G0005 [Berkelbacteria bacterium GW2011_GWA2_35_9]|uniref:Uncharacterized protein n=1 Tax=Berkelbacteria bacterium GW2011_GWA2_35_9 TaxID=1618333 RepID=A0A0G0GAI7_9BACT|nr:MAG: hypothetical protein UR93_C0009G0005 [Berkelbacteria bacterium GW2011_GWA2_35_9]
MDYKVNVVAGSLALCVFVGNYCTTHKQYCNRFNPNGESYIRRVNQVYYPQFNHTEISMYTSSNTSAIHDSDYWRLYDNY